MKKGKKRLLLGWICLLLSLCMVTVASAETDGTPIQPCHQVTMTERKSTAQNGASISVLMEAGAREADLVIAVTGVDETNLVCALIAKSVGAQHTIARVRNPEYRRDADMLKREIGLDMVINPDLAAAQEIARILSFPAAISVEPFAGGRIDMIGFQLHPEDTILGRSLSDFHRERVAEVLICAAQRGDEFIIPNLSLIHI